MMRVHTRYSAIVPDVTGNIEQQARAEEDLGGL